MLEIKSFCFGPFETNCYIVRDGDTILLIDPACSNEYEQQELLEYFNSFNFQPSTFHIIATHGHLDHLWGAKWATEQWNIPVLMHEADIPLAQAMQQQYNLFGIRRTPEPFPIKPYTIHHTPYTIIHTPGHTPGSICLYWPEKNVLFSGDTLFRMGYGRTDLPGGNMGQLIDSLEKLFALPADVHVYPGHGEETTIAAERR